MVQSSTGEGTVSSRLIAGSVAGLVLVFAAACGGGNATQPPSGSSPGATQRPASTRAGGVGAECHDGVADSGTVVELTTPEYPEETRIAAGEKITWTNNDDRTHTVTFRGGPDCGFMLIGTSVWIQFDNPGTYDYLDQFNDTMTGKVIVE